ncbi:hypothetical protein DPMN_060027 [Dreissena polymorpha]|uniref:Uncharacterized protein n=1 Tax=Dreissena polymorpha TaxID=45954 RepID=A0A9D4HFH9_DREPO|nr:hypothetical protein DPMN_060027 [Dreissena polymorpha]
MKEIWQQYGTGENNRMLPLYQAISRLGTPLVKTMEKAHILTGDDCRSKVGTKHSAQEEALAEKYLVRVWIGAKSTTTAETFDHLRLENDASASAGLDYLPHTSIIHGGWEENHAMLLPTK